MRIEVLVPLLASLAGAICFLRMRLPKSLPFDDPAPLGAILLVSWFAGLAAGQLTSSLSGMAWIAALSLAGCGILLRAGAAREGAFLPAPARWKVLDWLAFLFLSMALLAINGNDDLCHYSVVATYLRGNIPPSALNAPSLPLAYHSLFDAGAAVVSAALNLDPELALDLVSIVCVASVIEVLGGVSRLLFRAPGAQQGSRLFFLFGLGPTYLRWARSLRWDTMHGTSTQSFAEAIFRRPFALNFLVFTLLLGLLLPSLAQRPGPSTKRLAGLSSLLLVPIAFMLPVVSEELCLFATGSVVLLMALRKLSPASGFAWMLALALALPLSGSFRIWLHPASQVAFPTARILFVPFLPSWTQAFHGVALFSTAGLKTLFYEWGPVFVLGIWLAFSRIPAARAGLVPFIAITLLLPFAIDFSGWPRADLDRFYFYGTAAGFFLAGAGLDLLLASRASAGISRVGSAILLFLISASVVLGPIGYLTGRVLFREAHFEQGLRRSIAARAPLLRETLAQVGPRDRIVTTAEMAQDLVLAGFVVPAPMSSSVIGKVDVPEFDAYLRQHGSAGEWLFLPESDPRVAARKVFASIEGYALVRP